MERYKSFMNDKLAKLLFKQGSKWEDHLHQIETAHNPVTCASVACLSSCVGTRPRDIKICTITAMPPHPVIGSEAPFTISLGFLVEQVASPLLAAQGEPSPAPWALRAGEPHWKPPDPPSLLALSHPLVVLLCLIPGIKRLAAVHIHPQRTSTRPAVLLSSLYC